LRFWDSSAIVPLIVEQVGSRQVDRWFSEDPEVALWTLTPVELTSALHRLVRDGRLSELEAASAESRVDELIARCQVVINVEAVKRQARRLLRLHTLRAADALQLGAAIEWSGGRTMGRCLHTLDAQLARAAAREGFDVVPKPV
jgi:predicted nucleic acid-binding protein